MTKEEFDELVETVAERMVLDDLNDIFCTGEDAKNRLARAKENNDQDWLNTRHYALSACIILRELGYLK